jgi:hypothetical protein
MIAALLQRKMVEAGMAAEASYDHGNGSVHFFRLITYTLLQY